MSEQLNLLVVAPTRTESTDKLLRMLRRARSDRRRAAARLEEHDAQRERQGDSLAWRNRRSVLRQNLDRLERAVAELERDLRWRAER